MHHDHPQQPAGKRPRRGRARQDTTPVVRVDIFATGTGPKAVAREIAAVPDPAPPVVEAAQTDELERRAVALDARERSLAARAAGLDDETRRLEEERERLHAHEESERVDHRAFEQRLAELTDELEECRRELAAREAELVDAEAADDAVRELERHRRRLAAREESLTEQAHDLDVRERTIEERESELAQREAELHVELELRAEELGTKEQTLAEQELRLSRKENDLTAYVGQLQERLRHAGSTVRLA